MRGQTQKLPIRWRIKAWWEGYDSLEIEEKIARSEKNHTAQADIIEDKIAREAVMDDASEIWNEDRVNIAQMIWGDGFCGPGGREYVIAMSKLLALQPSQSAVVIGAGIGGPARVLADETGVWINAYESCKSLADKGMELSAIHGLDKKSPIIHKNLNDVTEFDRNFDRAYSKDTFYTIKNKTNLFQIIFKHLKENGLFLLTDYVLADNDALEDPHVKTWLENEPVTPYPVTSNTMTLNIEDCGYLIRVCEDITEDYIKLITEAWEDTSRISTAMSPDGKPNVRKLQSLLQEAELWNRRTKIMRSGKLKVFRYLIFRPPA